MVLADLLKQVPAGGHVLDYGCFGWRLVALAGRNDLQHHGCDLMMPDGKPDHVIFHQVNASTQAIDVPDDSIDLVVASHVIEHVADPIRLFHELARVCRPGGSIYIEAPSERSLLVASDPDIHSHAFHSFWDDPTHIRPWTPAALYRLAVCHGYVPVEARYLTSWQAKAVFPFKWFLYRLLRRDGHKLTEALWAAKGWACYSIIQKPADMTGAPAFKYLTLRDIPRGIEPALALYRGHKQHNE